jgi:hypothetical protein
MQHVSVVKGRPRPRPRPKRNTKKSYYVAVLASAPSCPPPKKVQTTTMMHSFTKATFFVLFNALVLDTLQTSTSLVLAFTFQRCITRLAIPFDVAPRLLLLSSTLGIDPEIASEDNGLQTPYAIRHDLFRNTNAISRKVPIPHPEVWQRCFQETNSCHDETKQGIMPFWDSIAHNLLGKQEQQESPRRQIVTDVEVIFEDPSIGAELLMEKCGLITHQNNSDEVFGNNQSETIFPEAIMMEQQTLQHLTRVLSYYQSIVSTNTNNDTPCRARVVSTVGSIGTKCPRWHADHIPIRLIMSLLGPGCEYIPHEMETIHDENDQVVQVVNRNALNNLEDDHTTRANDVIVPRHLLEIAKTQGKEVVRSAHEGEAVLLVGRGWEEEDGNVLAAVHRSPKMRDGEKRILLTVDVANWDYRHQ